MPGNSTSLLWEEDFLLWEASKTFHNHFGLLSWEQHQFIEPLWFIVLGTAPVYYGRRIFYYGRPLKLFTTTLDYCPGNSTSLLWEEDFLLWEASKTFHKDFGFFAWEQHQFIMGGGFFIMGGL